MFEDYKYTIAHILRQYDSQKDTTELSIALDKLVHTYGIFAGIADHLIHIGESYIENGDQAAGFIFLQTVSSKIPLCIVMNKVTLFLRMADYHFQNCEEDLGIEYLTKLCTQTVDNYEESIEINGLTEVWQKYMHYIAGKVPASICINNTPSPLDPKESQRNIQRIFALPKEEILSELSAHLQQQSIGGEYLNGLNKWELTFFYIDELCMEVNSGGFGHYLYYYGHHFEKCYHALEAIQSKEAITLLDQIKAKFPKQKISRSIDRLQSILDDMEENGIDFEKEDEMYYDLIERQIMDKLLDFVLQNQQRFK